MDSVEGCVDQFIEFLQYNHSFISCSFKRKKAQTNFSKGFDYGGDIKHTYVQDAKYDGHHKNQDVCASTRTIPFTLNKMINLIKRIL